GYARTIGSMSLAVVAFTPFSYLFALLVRLLFGLLRLAADVGRRVCLHDRRLRNGLPVGRAHDYGRYADNSGSRIAILDLGAACADQSLISGHERHVGIDKDPTGFGRHLHVEMQVIGGAALRAIVVADLSDDFTLVHKPAADDAVGVKLVWVHVHVAHTHMHRRRIDEQVDRFLLACAQNEAVMGCDHLVLIRLAAVGAVIEQRAGTGPDVLTLVAFASRTLADIVPAMFAEIVAPGIRVVDGRRLVEDQRPAVHFARVRLVLAPRAP